MQTQDLQAEISALESQLKQLNILLDQSFRNNEILAKTKIIYHDVKLVSDRLQKLKEMDGADSK